MSKRTKRRLFLLLALLISFVIAAALGLFGTQDRPAEYVPSQAVTIFQAQMCAQPCWHGIRPGVTTLSEAIHILDTDSTLSITNSADQERRPSSPLCWVTQDSSQWDGCAARDINKGVNSPIESVTLTLPRQRSDTLAATLGDAIAVFGLPESYVLCWRTDTTDGHIFFANGISVDLGIMYATLSNQMTPLDPHLKLQKVIYTAPPNPPPGSRYARPWRGFMTPPVEGWQCRE